MIKSISVWAFESERPLPEVFQMAKKLGFGGVEVAVGDKGALTPATTQAECEAIVRQAQAAGVQLVSLASGLGWQYQLTSVEAANRQTAIKNTAQSLRLARWLGTDAILCVPGAVGAEGSGFNGTPYDQAYENATASLRELLPVAQETGVSIGIENVWNKFLLSPLEMRDFIDQFDSPHIGCYFDVGNLIITGFAEQWITILGSRIKRIHFKDFKRSVGTLEGFCDLLDGDVDYPAVMRTLRATGYDGAVTSEFFNCEADLPKISAAMDKILKM